MNKLVATAIMILTIISIVGIAAVIGTASQRQEEEIAIAGFGILMPPAEDLVVEEEPTMTQAEADAKAKELLENGFRLHMPVEEGLDP